MPVRRPGARLSRLAASGREHQLEPLGEQSGVAMRALVGQGRGDGQVGAGVAEQAVDAFAVAGVHADPQALLHERRQSVGQPRGDEVGGAGDVQRAGQSPPSL